MTDSLDTSEGEAMPWVKPAQSESGDEDAQTMTKEERALGAFLAAMHDSKLDGGNMRAAMLKVLGLETSTAERLRELEEEIAVSDKLLEHRQQLLQAIPPCPGHGHGCVPHALDWIEQQKRGAAGDVAGGEWKPAGAHLRCRRCGTETEIKITTAMVVTRPQAQQGWQAVAADVSSRVIEVLADMALAPVLSKQMPESNRSFEYIDREIVVKGITQIRRAVSELAEYTRLSAAQGIGKDQG